MPSTAPFQLRDLASGDTAYVTLSTGGAVAAIAPLTEGVGDDGKPLWTGALPGGLNAATLYAVGYWVQYGGSPAPDAGDGYVGAGDAIYGNGGVVPPPSPGGFYATSTDLNDLYGTSNVTAWSDTAGAGNPDTARISRALARADSIIDSFFRVSDFDTSGGHLALLDPAATLTATHWAATLAAAWLYQHYGLRDEATTNKLTEDVAAVRKEMNDAKVRPDRLNASRGGARQLPAVAGVDPRSGVPTNTSSVLSWGFGNIVM